MERMKSPQKSYLHRIPLKVFPRSRFRFYNSLSRHRFYTNQEGDAVIFSFIMLSHDPLSLPLL